MIPKYRNKIIQISKKFCKNSCPDVLRGVEARFVNIYVLPARVLDALLDSVVGTMPVQCRHTTSQGSTEKRGAPWIRTRYAIRFVPSGRAILFTLPPRCSAKWKFRRERSILNYLDRLFPSSTQNSSSMQNQRPFDSSRSSCPVPRETRLLKNLDTIDTIS